MKRSFVLLAFALLAVGQGPIAEYAVAAEPETERLLRKFKEYSGAELVFHREDLPEGRYHDVLKPLSDSRKAIAAAICVEEARMYPPGFFGEVGLNTRGSVRCLRVEDDERSLSALRHPVGRLSLLWRLQWHATRSPLRFTAKVSYRSRFTTKYFTTSTQRSMEKRLRGNYPATILFIRLQSRASDRTRAPPIAGDDLAALRDRCIGYTLQDAVSDYAAKNSREDQAETARHLMSMLPNSLVQAIEQPELAGSQRILHVLREYEHAVPDGPGIDWFVDVALERARRDAKPETVDQLLVRLKAYADGGT